MRKDFLVVAIIGSHFFKNDMQNIAVDLTKNNCIVLMPDIYEEELLLLHNECENLREMAKRRIDMCDEVLVVNANSLVDLSNKDEFVEEQIKYAKDKDKKINYYYAYCDKSTCIHGIEFCYDTEWRYCKRVIGEVFGKDTIPYDNIPVCEHYLKK